MPAFGRHLQHLDDESRLVFYPLRIASERLIEKNFYVGLKLLPSLIRCLLIHAHDLLFFKKNDGWFYPSEICSVPIRADALTGTVGSRRSWNPHSAPLSVDPHLPRKAQCRHPFSILNSEVIVCDNSMRFSERIFIRMNTKIITIYSKESATS